MRVTWIFLTLFLAAGMAHADAPQYDEDPFGDSVTSGPRILEVAHPTRGHGELALMFSSSMIDKYSSHMGTILDFTYHFTDTFGASVTVGFLHGALTTIVTDREGIIGNKMQRCLEDSSVCGNLNPNVPDYKQVTGLAEANFVWAPLYGKINVVSELDVSLQVYGIFGVGMNGTRDIQATANAGAAVPEDYTLTGGGFGESGFFSNAKVNFSGGGGIKVFVLDWMALRAELRGLFFVDEFDFGDGPESYLSRYWFGNVGLSFTLF